MEIEIKHVPNHQPVIMSWPVGTQKWHHWKDCHYSNKSLKTQNRGMIPLFYCAVSNLGIRPEVDLWLAVDRSPCCLRDGADFFWWHDRAGHWWSLDLVSSFLIMRQWAPMALCYRFIFKFWWIYKLMYDLLYIPDDPCMAYLLTFIPYIYPTCR